MTDDWYGLGLADKELALRVGRGEQPELPYTDVTSIAIGNVFYLVVCYGLYAALKDREAVPDSLLRPIMFVYNIICVFLAGYVVYGVGLYKLTTLSTSSFACNKLDVSAKGLEVAHYMWWFYAQKYFEFFDTFFFLLRKSNRQVTILHLYHHSSITVVVGFLLHYGFSGDLYLPVLLNSFVHVLMYSHYACTIIKVNTWWKSSLTSLQLIQFLLIASQSIYSASVGHTAACPIYPFQSLLMILYMITMIVLFSNFYIQSYVKGGAAGKSSRDSTLVYSGTSVLDVNGTTTVALPADFAAAHRRLTTPPAAATAGAAKKAEVSIAYLLTPIGSAMPELHVSEPVSNGFAPHVNSTAAERTAEETVFCFTVAGGTPSATVSWVVYLRPVVADPVKPKVKSL